jgi:hypothetical protein
VPIPAHLNPLIAEALTAVRKHPKHQFPPLERRKIYEAFGSRENLIVDRACGWLGIITAKRVLPIFTAKYPQDKLPERLIRLAERVVRATLDKNSWRVQKYLDYSYHASGNSWGYDEYDLPLNVDLAGYAARKALGEAIGGKYLHNLDNYAIVGASFSFTDGLSGLFNFQREVRGSQLTDEQLATIEVGDTASAAAVASAYSKNSIRCHPKKLLAFWEWWLLEAIPLAWEKAENNGDL